MSKVMLNLLVLFSFILIGLGIFMTQDVFALTPSGCTATCTNGGSVTCNGNNCHCQSANCGNQASCNCSTGDNQTLSCAPCQQ